MSTSFKLKILTPNRQAMDTDVVSIVAPGEAGYLGVLANHAPLITTLKAGKLTVRYVNHTGHEDFKIGGGILKVAQNEAIILTESVDHWE